MELLTANLAGRPRRECIGDREYLVAPMTLIVPGVLNGSQGPLFYPLDEVTRDPSIWNGIPITVRHPERDGKYVSARHPGVLSAQGVGTVFNATANGKLTAEAWFDVERFRAVDSALLAAIANGSQEELSTGLYTDNEPAENGAKHNGRAYTHIARNHQPDHLAILQGQQGACSVADGCGVNVNQQSMPIAQKLADLYRQTSDTLLAFLHGSAKSKTSVTNSEIDMSKLTDQQRKTLVDNLVAGCCYEEDDRETLNALPDDNLKRLAARAEEDAKRDAVVNAVKQHFGPELTVNEMPEALKKAAAAKKGDGAKDKDEDEAGGKKKKEPTGNVKSALTEEQWKAQAPPEIVEDLAFAREEKAKQKAAIVAHLTANAEGDTKARLEKRLSAMPLDQLRDLAPLVPEPQPTEGPVANWAGAAALSGLSPGVKLTPMGLPGEYLDVEKV